MDKKQGKPGEGKVMNAEFEVWLDNEFVASASGPRDDALREALRYYSQYMNDGTVEILEVKRTLIPVVIAS